MSDRDADLVAAPSQTIGPFFDVATRADVGLGRMAPPGVSGDRIRLRIRVVDGDGAGVPDALLELWQADADGRYGTEPGAGAPRAEFCGFGRLPTGADGVAVFETIRPGAAIDAGGRGQAPHINIGLFARGLLRHLYTRVYFAGDPALAGDPLLALVPADRRSTLVATKDPDDAWAFEIRLQGGDETVFFDL